MKLLIDMNLSSTWVDYLSDHGISAIHWLDIGVPEADDSDIFNVAVENGFTILTLDLDFGALLAASQTAKPSVVILRSGDARPAFAGPVVTAAITACSDLLMHGALVVIDHARMRVRVLPITES